jgi:phosphohistidine phosphatase SixA
MPFVYVLRHAKALKHGDTDHARKLSEKGESQALAFSTWLVQSGVTFDQVIVSDSARTMETLELLDLDSKISIEPKAYNASAQTLGEFIRESGAQESVLVIAHNPGVSDLCQRAGYGLELRTCELVILECSTSILEFSPDMCDLVGNFRPEVD